MKPEDPEEPCCPGFGPPWVDLADIFRQLHEQDTTRPVREPVRLDPRDWMIVHAWGLRDPKWMALRAN